MTRCHILLQVVEEETKKKKSFFSCKRLLKFILFIAFCVVAYDICKHKSYRGAPGGWVIRYVGGGL